MHRSNLRTLCAALAISGLIAQRASAQDAPHGHSHGDPAAKAAHEMAHAADNLWKALTDDQKKKAGYAFKDDQRYDWHFIPKARKGLPWKEMTPAQQALAHGLLASGMSSRGYIQAQTIMSLEAILKEIEGPNGAMVRDSELYYFTIFGTPGGKDPWGWRVEGHHLSLNFTVSGDKGAVGGPTFMGANPGEVRTGPRKGLRALGHEEDLGRKLVKMLSDDQKKKAIISTDAPKDIISMVARKAKPIEGSGLLAADMTAEQKAVLADLVSLYAEKLRPEIASQDLAKIFKAGVDKVGFVWAGGVEPGDPHYYRIQGPTFLLEYDNTQNNANHIHTVWRDFDGDFGEDLLKRHYASAPDGHGHDHAEDAAKK
jgi:Protein of unknown function (DUF3500)